MKIQVDEQADSSTAGAKLSSSAGINLLFAMTEGKTLEQQVTQLFENLRMPVYQYLVSAFGNAAEAEDTTQDAFLQLYKALREGQSIRDARFWIFRVAHNLAINRGKHNKFIAQLDADSWREVEERLLDKNLNPEQNILQREKYERVYEGLKLLSIQERQSLYLRAEGFKYKEIAEIMNIAVPTVGEFLRRGIRKLTETKR
jgi:RNA polymerase sigma-70 factor (ECF subfamily)